MSRFARDVMTPNPAVCTTRMTLDQVARLMVQNDCGEIPVIDVAERPIGVVTDRDIVCRAVAEGKHPSAHTVDQVMSQPVVTVSVNTPIEEVVVTMEKHQIRRVPVVDEQGACAGNISTADVAWVEPEKAVAELVREVSRDMNRASR
jgi:CBS domain-containing protein